MIKLRKSLQLLTVAILASALVVSCQEQQDVRPDGSQVNLYEAIENFDQEIEYYGYDTEAGSSINGRKYGSWKRGKKDWYSKRPKFRTLTVALARTGLISTVVRGDITVFAPTDEAFAQLGITPRNVGQIPNLKEILLYHVLGSEVYSTDLTNGCFATVQGEEIRVDLNDGVFINDAQVIKADIKAFRGVFHIVDRVLFAPDKNIVEIAASNDDFSILVEAVTRVDLGDALSGENDLTVFAPTNDAFIALLGELGATSLDDIDDETLKSVLLYHVVEGKVCSNELTNGLRVNTLNGASFVVDLDNLSLNDANGRSSGLVTSLLNLQATNGVIHVIDQVILPPLSSIAGIAAADDNFSILVEALDRVDLVATLDEGGPYTVFAPTNDAFIDLLDELGATSLDDIDDETLKAVLLYHVVEGRVYSNNLEDGLEVPTVGGGMFTFDLSGTPAIIDARGRTAELNTDNLDIQANNGVIHVLDRVILP